MPTAARAAMRRMVTGFPAVRLGSCRPTNEPLSQRSRIGSNTIGIAPRMSRWGAGRLRRVRNAADAAAYLDAASSEPLHPAARETLLAAPRPRVRRPAPAARPRPRRPAAARQRPRGGGRVPRRAAGRGHLHLLGHRRRAPRPARARAGGSPAATASCTPPSSTPPSCTPLRWAAPSRTRSPVDRRRARVDGDLVEPPSRRASASWPCRRANHEVGTLQPVAERRRCPTTCPLFVDACASMGRLPLPARLGRARGLGAQVGRPGRRRRAAGPQGRPLAQPVPRRRPRSTSGSPASRTSRPRSPPPPRSRRWSPSATRSTPASSPWSTGSGPAVAEIPDVEVVGDPVDRLPHLVTFSCLYVDGEALVDRARPARVRRRQRLGLHRLDPRARATCWRRWACSPTATSGSR